MGSLDYLAEIGLAHRAGSIERDLQQRTHARALAQATPTQARPTPQGRPLRHLWRRPNAAHRPRASQSRAAQPRPAPDRR